MATAVKNKNETALRQFVFTAANVKEITERGSQGFEIKRWENPWFKNLVGVRKAGCPYGWTDGEMTEFAKCKMDIHYFANNYCKIKTEDGKVKQMKLRDYQYKVLDVYAKNRFVINMSSRQTGKTVTAAITLLHFCLFNDDKGVMIVANKGDTVVEIIDKIKNIYKLLPFFLQRGIVNWHSKAIVFENGCRIKSQARSKEPAIGFTIDFLYMDEFAHLPSSIARSYYKSAVPTVSNINNSKILITSTPNGSNLFKELVEGAELPEGHPDKNQYKCIRVYWHEVAGRMDPKFYPIERELRKHKVGYADVRKTLAALGMKVTDDREQTDAGERDVLRIDYEDGKWDVEKIRSEVKVGNLMLAQLGTLSNWKENETKLIGGEENFNQEYNIQFISGSKRILSAKTVTKLEARKTVYSWDNVEPLNRLQFTYDELRWHPEFLHAERKKIYGINTLDISEGLGQDYSTVNMFKLCLRSPEWLAEHKIKNMFEAFYLKQIGIYQGNRLHPTELADMFYLLQFEYFEPEKWKTVFEVNGPGGRFYDAMPHAMDGNNQFGDYIFVRYKHNQNNQFKKPGKKVKQDKKDDVKLYIKYIEDDTIFVDEVNTQLEMENFIKVETRAGNITYKADAGHDDIVMGLVNMSTLFETREWQNLCHEYYTKELTKEQQEMVDRALDLGYNPNAQGYKSLSKALNKSRGGINRTRFRR